MKSCLAGLCAVLLSSAFAATTITGTVPVPSGEVLTIDVPSGETYEYAESISGDGGVLKTGAGTLVLSGDNSFTGGFELQDGSVEARSETAFGVDTTVTISSQNTGTRLILNASDGTFRNDFAFTGKAVGGGSDPVMRFAASGTIDGDITFVSESYIGSLVSGLTISFNGAVGTSDRKTGVVYVMKGATTYFNGPVYATNFYDGIRWDHTGTVHFKSSENGVRDYVYVMHGKLVCDADNVFGTASPCFSGDCSSAGAMFDLAGTSQQVPSLTFNNTKSWVAPTLTCAGGCLTSGDEATLTIVGTGANKSAYSFWTVNGAVSLVLDAAETFTQVFTNRASATTGSIHVKGGTLKLTGNASFKDAASLTVDSGASFVCESTEPMALGRIPTVEVNGAFTIGEEAVNPFDNGLVTLSLGADSIFTLPEEMQLKVAALYVDGEEKDSSDDVPQIVGGSVVVMKGPSTDAWVGGGASESVAEAANWKGGKKPDRTGGLTATFADATATSFVADIDTDITFAKINLASDAGFAFTGENRMSVIDGGLSVAQPAADFFPVYAFMAPFGIERDTVIDAPAGTTLRFERTSFTASRLAKLGEGDLVLAGTNAFAGTVIVSNGNTLVTGTLTTPSGLDETVPTWGKNIDKENLIYFHLAEGGLTTKKSTLCVSNAVIEKPLWFQKNGGGSWGAQLSFPAGTTNRFRAHLMSADASSQNVHTYAGSVTYLEGGASFVWTFYQYELGTLWIRNKPIKQSGGTAGYSIATRGTTVFAVAGNSLPNLSISGDGGVFDFRVDHALNVGTALKLEGSTSSLKSGSGIRLNSTVQRVGTVTTSIKYFNAASFINGEPGSELLVTNTAATVSSVAIPFTGAASLRLDNPGTLELKGVTSTSTGAVTVAQGTLTVRADANWASASAVNVIGTGSLVIEAPDGVTQYEAFGHRGEWRLDGEGLVTIPDGVRMKVNNLYIGGRPLDRGWYSSGSSDPEVAKHFAQTTGSVYVRHPGEGIVLIVR